MTDRDELLARADALHALLDRHLLPPKSRDAIEAAEAALRAVLADVRLRDEQIAERDDALREANRSAFAFQDESERLRVALATQPQPLFEGRVVDATVSARFTIQADSAGVTYPGPNDRVVVYPATAGSATPSGDDHE